MVDQAAGSGTKLQGIEGGTRIRKASRAWQSVNQVQNAGCVCSRTVEMRESRRAARARGDVRADRLPPAGSASLFHASLATVRVLCGFAKETKASAPIFGVIYDRELGPSGADAGRTSAGLSLARHRTVERMVGHYGRRASYTASWNQRLYPRQEPTFDAPASAAATIERRERAGPTPPTCAPPATEPVAVPPPLYFPGEAQLARTRSQPTRAGHLSSINVARSQTATIPYRTHPTLRIGWRRLLRVGYYYRCLKSEREFFDDAWPSEFGGRRTPRTAGDEECDAEGGGRVSRSTSRRSGVSEPDSGVALTPRTTLDLKRPQHPLEALFKARVAIINDKVALALVPTRVMLSILEIMDLSFVILLIIALGIERGRQRGFLQGVEVSVSTTLPPTYL